MKNILVTGGMGFIGSHTVVALIEHGYNPIVFDNLSNSYPEVLDEIETITGKNVPFFQGDIRERDDLEKVFAVHPIYAVMHFAALKSVAESCKNPGLYYENNIGGTITLLNTMEKFGVKKIIFSGSATVYGDANSPVNEGSPTGNVTNPYGMTKRLCEKLLEEKSKFTDLQSISLRYFNPIGSHPSGRIGENVPGIPNNVFPYLIRVLNKELDHFYVLGGDYPTPDGTGVRDFIDIIDLAQGHIAALQYLEKCSDDRFFDAINLGTGRGTSVLQLIEATQDISGIKIPYTITDRRQGDVAEVYASVDKAKKMLGREAQYTIQDSIRNTLQFIMSKNTGTF